MSRDEGVITCPDCGMKSFNPNDVLYGYCGNCHDFTGERAIIAPEFFDDGEDGYYRHRSYGG